MGCHSSDSFSAGEPSPVLVEPHALDSYLRDTARAFGHGPDPVALQPAPLGYDAVDRLGEAFIKRAYGDWSHGNLSGWQSVGRVRGVREMQHSPCASGKNATDIALAVDAVDLMHTRDVDVFVIVSGGL